MLQLQLKNRLVLKLPKKTIFFIKLSFFCAVAHLFALIFFFLVPDLKKTLFLDMVHTNNASIVFVPFLKTAFEQQGKSDQKKMMIVPSAFKQPLQQKKEVVKKMPIKKAVQQPLLKKQIPIKKNVVSKKAQPIKKIIKPILKKPELKKQNEVNPKKQELIPEQPKKVETVKPIPVPDPVAETKAVPENNVQLVGRDDMELIMLSTILKQDIIKVWKRPANIPPEALCQVRVILDKEGSREVIIEKASQALALDISVRNFLLQYDFPQQVYGKELSIIF
jgi:hypothetical protein